MKQPLIVIGISGVARSGKDTVANHLVTANGFFRIALADGIRESLNGLDGPTWQLRKEFDEHEKTARWAMQTLGGEGRSGLDESAFELWTSLALVKIHYLSKLHPVPRHKFVIPDVRYDYEPIRLKRVVRQMGGHYETWKINRPTSGLTGEAALHESERGVERVGADVVIQNHLDLGYMFGQVDTAVDQFVKACQ